MKIQLLQKLIEEKIEVIGALFVRLFRAVVLIMGTKKFNIALQWLGWIVLLSVSIYIGTEASLFQRTTSDQFLSTFIFGDILNGAPMISSDHTNIIKLPLLWLQDNLSYSLPSYIALNVFFIFSSIALWVYLTGRAFGKDVRTLSTFVFAAVLFGSTIFAINITMTTLRHIEYPLGLIFVLMISNLLISKRKYVLYKTIGAAILLALLILNDKYFLYTLAPATLFGVLIFAIKARVSHRKIAYSLAAILAGIILGILLPRIINATGIISIIPGYVQLSHIVGFEQLSNLLWLCINQTIDLFGGLFFGQEVRLRNLSMLVFFMIPVIGMLGVGTVTKHYGSNKTSIAYFFHIILISWLALAYASYILSGTANVSNIRYLTILVYIGVTYFSWFAVRLLKNHRFLIVALCLFMVLLIPLSYPRTHSTYKTLIDGSSIQTGAAKKIVSVLDENNIHQLIAPTGYSSLGFYSTQRLNNIVTRDCTVAVPWANNAAWIYQGNYSRSAYLFEEAEYAVTTNNFCPEPKIVQSYGKPEKIIDVPSIYTTRRPAKLYIYNYDIRSLITSNPNLRH